MAIHDSARPLVKADDVRKCLEDALEVRLATGLNSPLTGLLPCCRMRCPKQCTTGSHMLGWDRCPCVDITLPEELVQLAFCVRAKADHVQSVWGLTQVGAAVLGVAVKPTIKEVDGEGRVVNTLARAGLWEVQTPQVHIRWVS